MPSSGMRRRVDLLRADVSEATSSSETSVLTRVTRRRVLEDDIFQAQSTLNDS
jgi:hypothetical protein